MTPRTDTPHTQVSQGNINAYKHADSVTLEIDTPAHYLTTHSEDTTPNTRAHVAKSKINPNTKLAKQATTNSTKSTTDASKNIHAHIANPEETAAPSNLPDNPDNEQRDTDSIPKPHANVHTRGKTASNTRNATDTTYHNNAHGTTTNKNAASNSDPNAANTPDSGRNITTHQRPITPHADIPKEPAATKHNVEPHHPSHEAREPKKAAAHQCAPSAPNTIKSRNPAERTKPDDPAPITHRTQNETSSSEAKNRQ
ncbi:hypothetical protein SAMN02745178_00033 [Gemmiger formicilis]|uniref:Uncharacterized protein n=1 Tax=Gemmiger formicilis TaxID=745368 RepID=A0A1T4W6N6_9FIRM|nr:hypothetical protein [Gemmiger formicilis]SKA72906.1 hypothetical protein SAMN02745178_00033 [Gemmiger formicilis]